MQSTKKNKLPIKLLVLGKIFFLTISHKNNQHVVKGGKILLKIEYIIITIGIK